MGAQRKRRDFKEETQTERRLMGAGSLPLQIIASAKSEWIQNIRESPGNGWKRVRVYLEVVKHSAAKTYESDGDVEWSGPFAAQVLALAGVSPSLLTQKSPPELGGLVSPYRMLCLARLQSKARYVSPKDIQPGDILAFGRSGPSLPNYGDQIGVFIRRKSEDLIETVEGDSWGTFPDGSTGKGVVARERQIQPSQTVEGVRFGLRMLESDVF